MLDQFRWRWLAGGALGAFAACTTILGDDFTTSESSTSTTASGGGTTSSNGSAGGPGNGGASTTSSSTGSGAGGAGGSYDCTAPQGSRGALKLTQIGGSYSSPILVKSPPADPTRLFIVEQGGIIKVRHQGMEYEFLDMASLVTSGGERGLLGLAFHPDYEQNGRFFVHYSNAGGDTAIAEYARDPNNHNQASPGGNVFFQADQPYSNHNGGAIEFSPVDGYLYIALGDGGSGNDPQNNGQNLSTTLGKILRIDVDPTPYSNPPGNLTGGAPEIWDYGMRNPWRMSFDACTGDLYIGDVGQNAYEEIDIEPAGQGNRNYGWRTMEGMHCNGSINPNCNMSGLVQPALEYGHGQGCSVTGGYVYRGSAIPWLRGAYFYGDYCSGRIWSTRWNGTSASAPTEHTGDLQSDNLSISSFGQDAAGEIYVVDHSGAVYRIDAE